jgi:MFS family permease
MTDTNYDQLRVRYRARTMRRRVTIGVGLLLLMAGYALLAVSPDTPSQWVLIRVFAGFALLFVGFAVAILPILSRLTGGDD